MLNGSFITRAAAICVFGLLTFSNQLAGAPLSPARILGEMKTVANWQLRQPPVHATDDWTYGALYAGMMALDQVSDSPAYRNAMIEMGKTHQWKPAKRPYHADDHCVSQTYIELYWQTRDPAMIAPTIERFNFILDNQSTNVLTFRTPNAQKRWSWCDALFMSPPAWLRLYLSTGDKRYIDFMDREWKATSDYLYDKEEHLYFRDSTYFERREANGKKVFWSRGNGWVLAGLARVLQVMPPDHSTRSFYVQQYKEMAAKILTLQQPDGLWRSSLLDPGSYPLQETSGSGFYTFALAWGVNRGVLDRATYEPAVRKAWTALNDCVTAEGKLEHVQPVGADPKKFDPTHSDVYGVGAFLLAGSEMYRMALAEQKAFAYGAFMAQRKDDFAWENDRIAFRMYGPALERTGEISSGLDVWAKRARAPVIERWYFGADYHKDHGEGMDFYKVGPSTGCGATGILKDGKLIMPRNFVSYRILENGPQRLVFELGYAPYDFEGTMVTETRRMSLNAGSNLNRIDTTFDWTGGPETLNVAVGIVKHAGAEAQPGSTGRTLACWEPGPAGAGSLGTGVVMVHPGRFVEEAGHFLLLSPVKRGETLSYYAGACWDKNREFRNKSRWFKYVTSYRPLTPR